MADEPTTQPTPSPEFSSVDPLAEAAARTRGQWWASHLGWVLAALGLALVIYSYQWANSHPPEDFRFGGIRGDLVGVAVAIIGVALAIVFAFVPRHRGTEFLRDVSPERMRARAEAIHGVWRSNVTLAWIGASLMILGLAAAAFVWRLNAAADPTEADRTFGGQTLSYETWGLLPLGWAGAGFALWVLFGLRARVVRRLFEAYVAMAARGSPVGIAAQGVTSEGPMPLEIPSASGLPGNVKPEEVVNLMRKIDGLLGTLPDNMVSAFSKTAEAETYLKLLSGPPAKKEK